MLRLLKWLVFTLMALLVLILSFQNLATIQIRFLFSTIELPQAVVIVSSLVIGFLMGLLATALWRVRNWRANKQRDKAIVSPNQNHNI